jgi:hypothetical protein
MRRILTILPTILDPRQSSAVTNSSSQLHDDYATDADSVVACTTEKKIEEQDGLSDDSDLHTPAQQSKRRRLPSLSPVKRKKAVVAESDSDGSERDSLFDVTPTRKRGFKRPRQPWSLVKEWNLEQYDMEVAYEEIQTILGQSLDEAGSKTYIKPNANAIAGWRAKQVSYFFHFFLISFCTIDNFLHGRITFLSSIQRAILSFALSRSDADAMSNFVSLRQRMLSSLKRRVSILPRVMFKTRFQSF